MKFKYHPILVLLSITLAGCTENAEPPSAPPDPAEAITPQAAAPEPAGEPTSTEVASGEVNVDNPFASTSDGITKILEKAPKLRPDENWRSFLSPMLADAEPKYSQLYEEIIIRDFFQDRRDGTFLDVGCYLPHELSTTAYLELELGWSGIAIDAIAEYARRWKRTRPNSKFVSYAVTDRDGDTLTFHVLGPLSSLDKEQAEQFPGAEGKSTAIEVETITLNTLLDREGVTSIDFLSLDIEGAEPMALKRFDIQRFAPELVCVERDTPTDEQILEYFNAHGYERLEKYLHIDKVNWYFAPKPQTSN